MTSGCSSCSWERHGFLRCCLPVSVLLAFLPCPKAALRPPPSSAPHHPDLHWATSAQAFGDEHPLPTCFS